MSLMQERETGCLGPAGWQWGIQWGLCLGAVLQLPAEKFDSRNGCLAVMLS